MIFENHGVNRVHLLSFELSDDEQAILEAAEQFAIREIKPVALGREWIEDAYSRFPWDIFEKAADVGLKNLTVPEKYGGLNASTTLSCLVAEKIAKADAGTAMAMGHWWKECRLIANSANKEQQEWFFPEFVKDKRYMLATTMSEAGHGSDHHLPFQNFSLQTSAALKNEDWVINGSKVFISNGAVAKLYVTYATTDPKQNFASGTSCFLVPRNSSGISVGTIFDKMGLRLANNAEVVFQDCRVSKKNLLGEVNRGIEHSKRRAKMGNMMAGCYALGCAEAAYEESVEYARSRVQGGKPIIEHQAVGLKLARMRTLIEAAKSLLYRACWNADSNPTYDPSLGTMTRFFSAETAKEVAVTALEVFGGNGIMLDVPIQKHVRDALCCLHLDGTQDIQLLKLHKQLLNH